MFNETRPHEKEIVENKYRIRHGNQVPKDSVNLAYTYASPILSNENVRVMDLSEFILENTTDRTKMSNLYPSESGLLHDENSRFDIYTQSVQLTHVFDEGEPLFYMYELQHYFYSKEKPNPLEYPKVKSILILDRNGNAVKEPYRYRMELIPTEYDKIYKVRIFTNFERKPGDDYKVLYSSVEIKEDGSFKTTPGITESLNPRPAFHMSNEIELNDLEYYLTPSMEFGYNRIFVRESSFYDDEYRKEIPFFYRIKAVRESTTPQEWVTPWIVDDILNPKSVIGYDKEYTNGWKTLFAFKSPKDIMSFYFPTYEHTSEVKYYAESFHQDVVISLDSKGDRSVKATYTGNVDTGQIYLPPEFIVSKVGYDKQIEIDFSLENVLTGDIINLRPLTMRMTGKDYSVKEYEYYSLSPYNFDIPSDLINNEWEFVIHTEQQVEMAVEVGGIKQPETYGYPNKLRVPLEKLYNSPYTLSYRYCEQRYLYKRRFSVFLQDENPIQVNAPLESSEHDQWYPRIQNGKFQKRIYNTDTKEEEVFLYSIPEYYRQWFDEERGLPVRNVLEETPKVAGENKIRLRHTPLYTTLDENNKPNIEVFALIKPEHEDMTEEEKQKNRIPLTVRAWDTSNGIVELNDGIKENDIILVNYYYEEYSYTYRGYWDNENQRFWNLDLNPSHGHYVTIYDKANNEIRDESSYWLINQTIYFYLRPVGKLKDRENVINEEMFWVGEGITAENLRYQIYEIRNQASLVHEHRIYNAVGEPLLFEAEGTFKAKRFKVYGDSTQRVFMDYVNLFDFYRLMPKTFKTESIFHTFYPLTEEEMNQGNYLLLGKMQSRPNSKINSLQIYDTRSRGGGLKEEIKDKLIKDLCPEAEFYWDIGYWDGEPYPENAVLVIRLPKYILKSNGGRFTEDDVRKGIEKHIAFGVFYLLEFIDESPEFIDAPINLEARLVTLPDDTIEIARPIFNLTTEELDCYGE